MNPKYEDIVKIRNSYNNIIRKTPLYYSETFSKMSGSKIYIKAEFTQKTGSFKLRGAYAKIRSLTPDEKKHGVIAASAGNHAQGVAYASKLEKIPCTIVMPLTASPAKVAATRGYGAKVILDGINYDESWAKAQQISKKTGAKIIHAFDDPQIIAANGAIGLEILEDLPDVDEIYVPIGGGGLAAGVLVAVKSKKPNIKVIGVESKAFPAMKNSVKADRLQAVKGARTIADGIAVKMPGKNTFRIINELIDDIVTVDDTQIVKTMFLLMERAKTVVEPAGAVALAYLIHAKPAPNKKVVPIMGGGNVDMYLLGQIVSKGLAAMSRLVKIFILLKDKPGALKEVVDEIASLSVNIVEVTHDRLSSEIDAGTAGVTLSLETEGREHAQKLIAHLKSKNIQFKLLT
ncbi:threonine ammonia-lyase [Candidatus Nitrosotenuis aquarius]|uniref:threonine ammonia-lyase n=1 Tax=Candidatus Nitrosotenuis aquarius TaxID=1846278 RepID=UPI000C1F60C4|nr:threonine ammonia-lyase [Candidatus Nitrosotenuis aquarius]